MASGDSPRLGFGPGTMYGPLDLQPSFHRCYHWCGLTRQLCVGVAVIALAGKSSGTHVGAGIPTNERMRGSSWIVKRDRYHVAKKLRQPQQLQQLPVVASTVADGELQQK
jgi:hypothetical protein